LKTPLGNPPESIQTGNYGQPPKAEWWIKQSFIYFLGLVGMKLCVYLIFAICPWLVKVGNWALQWTEGSEVLQITFVMLLFPLLMNALQYYVIDSFIKDRNLPDHLPKDTEDEQDAATDGQASQTEGRETAPGRVQEADAVKGPTRRASDSSRSGRKKAPRTDDEESDPETDGEDSPTVVGSGSSSMSGEARSLLRRDSSGKLKSG
jgi:hypothetical protein